jgi:hypothetical protein
LTLGERVVDDLSESYHEQSLISRPLSPGEQGVVTLTKPKSAALFADRVWSVGRPREDADMTFGWEIPMDVRWRAMFDLGLMEAETQGEIDQLKNAPCDAGTQFVGFLEDTAHAIAGDYCRRGSRVTPLYNSVARRDAEYKPGDQAAIVAIADGLMVVDEDRLAWEQVQEFRRDTNAHSAYRIFVHWLDAEMVGKPATFVADEVAARLERYDWALRKHGIETVTGALERTIQPGLLAGASAVGVSLQFITTQPVWSLLAAGGFVIGGTCLSLVKVLLDRKDVELAHREIAYVQQAKEILKDKKRTGSGREPANSAAPADQKAPLPGR